MLAAVDAGVDAADGAMASMSGLTSQPNLGSIVEALAGDPRDPGLERAALRTLDTYWEGCAISTRRSKALTVIQFATGVALTQVGRQRS